MQFDIKYLEKRIAYTIYFTCAKDGLGEFCTKNGFTIQDFQKFLECGVDGMEFERQLDLWGKENE